MRGNPGSGRVLRPAMGPIPAYAGQPNFVHAKWRLPGAYPRVCGATAATLPERRLLSGLSPRMRGNLLWASLLHVVGGPIPAYAGQPREAAVFVGTQGPIPAYAGQPCSGSACWPGPRAYPRVCGATENFTPLIRSLAGLSPRMRGNLGGVKIGSGLVGPIPAYAGQPPGAASAPTSEWAYPRVCGATPACRGRCRA